MCCTNKRLKDNDFYPHRIISIVCIALSPLYGSEKESPAIVFVLWQDRFPFCQAVDSSNQGAHGEVYISRMVEQVAKPGVMFRDTWFAGGRVLRCFHGRFYVRLEGCESIELSEGETIVSYPERHITIEALDNSNLLAYVVLEGRGTAAYFDRLGFFNGVHGPTSPQIELFREIKHRLESRHTGERDGLMMLLSDMLATYAHDLRVGANAVVGCAIRQIHENLANRIVRLAPLYEQLHIGPTALTSAFKNAGIGTPAKFIRQEQVRHAQNLLTQTKKSIAEIAEETGFISLTHFANFIKRMTGKTAREIRRGG